MEDDMWTFGRKIALGFSLSFALVLIIGAIAYRSINTLTTTSYKVTHTHQVLEHIALLLSELKDAETGQRGFVITGADVFLEPYDAALPQIDKTFKELRELTLDNPKQQERLDDARPLIDAKLSELKRTIALRKASGFDATEKVVEAGEGKKSMDDLRKILDEMEREERDLLRVRAADVEAASTGATQTILFGTLFCLLVVVGAGYSITQSLTSQVGSAVRHVQSSSSELQAAANQQATGAKEQATAMNEITTTINELLATSRQIAESAQRVAVMATDAAKSAKSGDLTVQKTQETVSSIKRQVDIIVQHMLDLGKKSQQIGGILEIINELAEQTNILAINATIEAAGAGDAGKRFGVVADEIRKLADRVSGSTKDIRKLVDDIRAAVNATVMVTEGGSKAVDAGTRQFGDVASSFTQIAGLVSTTTEAAREIELSTKQQSTAVEQVNVAIANVAQAARETEASSGQTLQTSSELTKLSKDLMKLVQAA
jgi:methyl-accepting chemotaxis protein